MNGFTVVFLFAGLGQENPQLFENSDGTYTLRVPTLECYELLSHKMELAYKYFSKSGCLGVLKIDDDIKILDKEQLKLRLNLDGVDYYGISLGSFRSPPSKSLHINKYTLNLFKTLEVTNSNITYAGGPFYWVSAKTIDYIVNDGLQYIYEDVSVGYVASCHPELVRVLDTSIYNTVIRWNNESEL